MQLVDAEIDDVAVEKDRDADEADQADADLGRDRLQEGRDLPVDHLRQRQHEDEVQHARPEHPAAAQAEDGQHHAPDPEDQRIGDDVGDQHEVAEHADDQRRRDDQEPRRPVRRHAPDGRHVAHLEQEHIGREQRDHRPVAVFGRRPGLAQRDQPVPENPCRADDREHQQARPDRRGRTEARHARPEPRIRIHRGQLGSLTLATRGRRDGVPSRRNPRASGHCHTGSRRTSAHPIPGRASYWKAIGSQIHPSDADRDSRDRRRLAFWL